MMTIPVLTYELAQELHRDQLRKAKARDLLRLVEAARPARPGLIGHIMDYMAALRTLVGQRLAGHGALIG